MGDIVGPILGYKGAQAQASATTSAARMQADAAREAAEMSRFRPVGLSTRFGSSQFGFDPKGNVSSAGYTLSPELKALQDYIFTQTGEGIKDTEGLLGLGRSYLSTTPETAAANYISQQNRLLAPSTESQLAGIRSNLQRTGRGGLAVGQGGALSAANPELQAYYNSLAMRDLQLGANAEQEARNRITFGQNLLSTAYSPLQTGLGFAGTIEELGRQPLELGVNIGGRQATANAAAGNLLSSGIGAAGRTMAGITDPRAALLGSFGRQITSGLPTTSQTANWFSNMIGGGSSGPTPADFGYNPNNPNFGGFDAGSSSTPGLWQTESYD
jgi:hypothetical protein